MAWFGDFRERPARDNATSPSVNLPSPSTVNGTAPPTVAASNGGSGVPLQEINFAILSLLVVVVLFFMLLLCFKSRRRARRAAAGSAGDFTIHSVTGGRATVAGGSTTAAAADLLPVAERGGLLVDAAARGGGSLCAKVAFSPEEIAKLGPVQRYKAGLFDGDSGHEEEKPLDEDEEMGEARAGARHGHGHGHEHEHGCAVCLGEYEVGENVRRLKACGHVFHQDCIDAWLQAKTSCPLCRCCLLQRSPMPSPRQAQPERVWPDSNTPGLTGLTATGDIDNGPGVTQSQLHEASSGVSGTAPQQQTAHEGQANVLPQHTPTAPSHWWQLRWLLPSS